MASGIATGPNASFEDLACSQLVKLGNQSSKTPKGKNLSNTGTHVNTVNTVNTHRIPKHHFWRYGIDSPAILWECKRSRDAMAAMSPQFFWEGSKGFTQMCGNEFCCVVVTIAWRIIRYDYAKRLLFRSFQKAIDQNGCTSCTRISFAPLWIVNPQ